MAMRMKHPIRSWLTSTKPDFARRLRAFSCDKGETGKSRQKAWHRHLRNRHYLKGIRQRNLRAEDAAASRRKGTPMTSNGTSAGPERSTRIDWVDYAKGICIVMVVMMHSVLGVEKAAGHTGFMHAFVLFAQAVPDAGFLPDLRPVPGRRDRPRLAHLSRPQGRALRLFLCAVGDDPVRLQGARLCRRERLGAMSACCICNPSSSRSARCGSSICCRSSSSSQNCRASVPPLAIWLVAAALEIGAYLDRLDRDRRILRALRLFLFRLSARRLRVRAGRTVPGQRPALALAGLALWALVNGGLVELGTSANGRWSRWRSGFAGAGAIIVMGTLLARMQWLNFLRYCGEHSIVIYLAFFLPMAATRTLLLKTGLITDIGTISLIVTVAGVVGAVAIWRLAPGAAGRLPVRAPRRFLDRAERRRAGAAAGGVTRDASRRSSIFMPSFNCADPGAKRLRHRQNRQTPDSAGAGRAPGGRA